MNYKSSGYQLAMVRCLVVTLFLFQNSYVIICSFYFRHKDENFPGKKKTFNRKILLLRSKLNTELRKKLVSCYVTLDKQAKHWILLNIMFFAPMGRFQLELIYLYFPPSSHLLYVCLCMFLSCRPFIVIQKHT